MACSLTLAPLARFACRWGRSTAGPSHYRTSVRPKPTLDASLDHLVGGHEHAGRHGEAKRLRGFEVDGRFKPGRGLHRKIRGSVAAGHIAARPRQARNES